MTHINNSVSPSHDLSEDVSTLHSIVVIACLIHCSILVLYLTTSEL